MDRVSQPTLCFSLKVLYQVCIAHFRGPMHASTSHQRWLHWSGKLQGQLHLRFKSYLSLQSRIYSLGYVPKLSQCLKIVQKVAFKIASYVYILSEQKLRETAKNSQFDELTEACGQTVLPDRMILIGQKMVKMPKFKWDILRDFQTL